MRSDVSRAGRGGKEPPTQRLNAAPQFRYKVCALNSSAGQALSLRLETEIVLFRRKNRGRAQARGEAGRDRSSRHAGPDMGIAENIGAADSSFCRGNPPERLQPHHDLAEKAGFGHCIGRRRPSRPLANGNNPSRLVGGKDSVAERWPEITLREMARVAAALSRDEDPRKTCADLAPCRFRSVVRTDP